MFLSITLLQLQLKLLALLIERTLREVLLGAIVLRLPLLLDLHGFVRLQEREKFVFKLRKYYFWEKWVVNFYFYYFELKVGILRHQFAAVLMTNDDKCERA